MPLLMLDLDNTLIDRDAAFRRAGSAFLSEHGLPETDTEWLVGVDAGGYAPRRAVALAMAERYGALLPDGVVDAFLDSGGADDVVLSDAVHDALGKAVADGWTCVIVTNGSAVQQRAKIRNAGLDRLVQGWAISEEVGHRKPSPRIFTAAAAAVGASLDGAWMVGDSAEADIAGAVAVGLRTVWVSNGRPWIKTSLCPQHIAPDAAAAIGHVIGATR